MIFDRTLLLSDQQAITADAASTNVIDLGAFDTIYGDAGPARRDRGKGHPIPLLVQVTEAFNNLTSLGISIQVDDNSSFSSPKTIVSQTIALADLQPGEQFVMDKIPVGTDERYLRIYYDVTGTAPTTGKVTAGVVAAIQTN